VASVAGVYGISFVLVVFNAGIAHVIADWLDRSASPAGQRGSRALTLLLATTPVVAASLAGGVMLRAAPPIDRTEGDFREVGVAQGNLAPGRTWRSDHYAGNLDVYLELTRKAADRETIRTVIWPEAAMSFYVETDEELRAAITATQRASDLELIAGGPRVDGEDRPSYFNSMFHLDASGTLRDTYDKQYLVPFFEFFPLEGLDFLRRDFGGPASFEHGAENSTPFETRLGKAGMLVCGEAMLPSAARDRVLAGAEILVSPSNDSWIEDEHFAEHMLRVSAMRAIEQRRFLVRSSTSGPSAVVDPWGRILVKTDAFQRAVLVGRVEPLQASSPYNRLGDAFAYGCVFAASLAALFGVARGASYPTN
jgi:apolipoprotein N-acyltransferase